MALSHSEFEDFQKRIYTVEDCEKKIKILLDLFARETDELEKLELNKYILRLQARLTALRVDSIRVLFED